jgi:hypothetical protein
MMAVPHMQTPISQADVRPKLPASPTALSCLHPFPSLPMTRFPPQYGHERCQQDQPRAQGPTRRYQLTSRSQSAFEPPPHAGPPSSLSNVCDSHHPVTICRGLPHWRAQVQLPAKHTRGTLVKRALIMLPHTSVTRFSWRAHRGSISCGTMVFLWYTGTGLSLPSRLALGDAACIKSCGIRECEYNGEGGSSDWRDNGLLPVVQDLLVIIGLVGRPGRVVGIWEACR